VCEQNSEFLVSSFYTRMLRK